jgi:hypothetical protein
MKLLLAFAMLCIGVCIFAGAGAVAGLVLVALKILTWAGFPYAIITGVIIGFGLCILLLFEPPLQDIYG